MTARCAITRTYRPMNCFWNNHRRLAPMLTLSIAALAPIPVSAQQIQMVGLDSVSAYVESSAFSDRIERIWASSRPLLQDNEHGFTEALYVGLRGFTYHPRFMRWSGNVRVTLKQRFLSNQTINSNRDINEYLQEYKFSSVFLKDHPVSVGFSVTRDISNTDGDFLESINVIRSSVAGNVSWRALGVSQIVRLSRTHYRSEGLIENEENRRTVQYNATTRTAAMYGSAQYQYSDNDFLTTGRGFIGHTARILGTFRLDKRGRRSITLSLMYNRQEDVVRNTYTEAALSAKLPISKQFDASSSYSYRNNKIDSLSSNVHSVVATFRHSLYQSLVTTLNAEGRFISFDAGHQRDVNPSVRLDYRKQTVFGSMNLFYAFAYRRFEDSFDRISQRFIERTFSVIPGIPILLDDRNIDSSSIEVLNLTRPAIIPQPGLDYTIEIFGSDFEVIIPVLSTILSGDDIKVSYFVISDKSFEFEESTRRYGAGLHFGRIVSIRASHLESDRSLISGTPVSRLDDIDVNSVALTVRYNGISTELEYQLRRTAINPYKRRSAQAQFTRSFARTINLVLSTAYVVTDFTDDFERSTSIQTAGRVWYRPRYNIIVESRLNNINRNGRRDDGHDFVWSNLVTYKSGQIEVRLRQGLYDRNVRVVGTEDRNIFSLSVRRSF